MLILPAIDLRGGQCVRLRQGDYAQETVFGDDPAAMARRWVEQGATYLHLVDLDGAREGRPGQRRQRSRHRRRRPACPASSAAACAPRTTSPRRSAGACTRVILGTRALQDPGVVRDDVPALSRQSRRSASTPSRAAWRPRAGCNVSELTALGPGAALCRAGRWPAIVYTDISRDGMLEGPNVEATAELAAAVAGAGDRLGRRDHARRRRRGWPGTAWPAASSAGPCTKDESTWRRLSPLRKQIEDRRLTAPADARQSASSQSRSVNLQPVTLERSRSWPSINVEDIRNIALAGHRASGKTSLADALLFKAKAVDRRGSVDDGTSVSDYDEEEQKRHFSIDTSVLHLEHKGKHVHLLDTPGYPDFVGAALGALNAVETAVVVVSAVNGVEVNTRRMFDEAGKRGLARMLVINKLDGDNVKFDELLKTIQRHLRQGLRAVQRADQRPATTSAASSACSTRPTRRRPAARSISPPRAPSWSTPSSRPTRR